MPSSAGTRSRWPARPARRRSPGKGDYSWYASFAPANDPKYVVVVLIEQGGEGAAAAAPAARVIYNALYDVKGTVVGGVGRGD